MNRIGILLSQIDVIDQMMTAKIQTERNAINSEFFTKLVNTHQKVSLAEKKFHVKNGCSPFSSDLQ
nr:endonuclease [Lysinibacillus timonensis]